MGTELLGDGGEGGCHRPALTVGSPQPLKNAPAELSVTLTAHLAGAGRSSHRDPLWHRSGAPGGSSIPATVLLAVQPARELWINVELI